VPPCSRPIPPACSGAALAREHRQTSVLLITDDLVATVTHKEPYHRQTPAPKLGWYHRRIGAGIIRMRTLACFLAHQIRIQLLKMAPIGAAMIVLAEEGMAANITVHAPDGEGRVFVDVVGKIDDGDSKPSNRRRIRP
jgi:hypothetical protein